MKSKSIIILVSMCLILVPSTANAFTALILDNGNYKDHDDCTGVTSGGTVLLDWDFFDATQTILNALSSEYSAFSYEIADTEKELKAPLYIDWYKAFDRPFCEHGAEITTHYVRHEDDPAELDWIQLYTERVDSGSGLNVVDGTGDNKPYYFTDADNREDYIHVPNPGGLIFGDSPFDEHNEAQPWFGGVQFYLFLASQEGNTITVYDGMTWGYTGACVPEPATLMLLGLGGLVLHRRKA